MTSAAAMDYESPSLHRAEVPGAVAVAGPVNRPARPCKKRVPPRCPDVGHGGTGEINVYPMWNRGATAIVASMNRRHGCCWSSGRRGGSCTPAELYTSHRIALLLGGVLVYPAMTRAPRHDRHGISLFFAVFDVLHLARRCR